MTKNELIGLFKDNTLRRKHGVSAPALANIIKFATVNLRMDDETLDYFYEVDIDELLESEMPNDEYEVMKEQGWGIKNNKLLIYI